MNHLVDLDGGGYFISFIPYETFVFLTFLSLLVASVLREVRLHVKKIF